MAGTKTGRGGERGQLIDIVPEWVRRSRPEWVACEQVPLAADVWHEHAAEFRTIGYATWVGILNAADYGVPQTRQRAVLLASRVTDRVEPPTPTHAEHPQPDLFGNELRRWVTAADAGVPGVIDRRQGPQAERVVVVDGNTRPAPTVTGKAVGQWLIDGAILRPRQAAALQAFPPDWPWQGNQGEVGRQIGNAVPPPLAAAILAAVVTP